MGSEKILHYRIERHIGSGAFGDVSQAFDEKLKRYVAIKIMVSDEDTPIENAERFKLEIGATVDLVHPNIVTVFDTGTHNGKPFYVMSYLPGGDLKQKNNALTHDLDIVKVCLDVTKALAYAHDSGFVHRDIKPENILFDSHGNAVVADFGLVKAMKADKSIGGGFLGTPLFSSPEQLEQDGEVDGRSDLYSLGRVLHFMLTKRKIPPSEPMEVPYDKALFRPILDKLLSTNKNERYATAHQVIEAFEALQLQLKQQAQEQRVAKPNKKLRHALWLTSAVGLLAVLTFGYAKMERDPEVEGQETNKIAEIALTKSAEVAPTPEQPLIKSDGIVSFTSQPLGAEVFLGDELLGKTPLLAETIPVGTQTFLLKKQFYIDKTIQLVIESKKIAKKSITLEKGSGSLSIITKTAGARVWIDGQPVVGETPLSIDNIIAGKKIVELRMQEASQRHEVVVEHNQTTLVRAALDNNSTAAQISLMPATAVGRISINTNPPNAILYLNGVEVGSTPYESESIEEGVHTIKITHPYFATEELEVNLTAKSPVRRFIELEPGRGAISILSNPANAIVKLNNKEVEQKTPLSLDNLPAGKYAIDIRKGELQSLEEVVITHDRTLVVDAELQSGNLISWKNAWLTPNEILLSIAEAESVDVKTDAYLAILALKPDHEETLTKLETLKTEFVDKTNALIAERKYAEARLTSAFIIEKFSQYFTIPNFEQSINESEQASLLADIKKRFAVEEKKISLLINEMHFDEAVQSISALPQEMTKIEEFKTLKDFINKAVNSFEQNVLSVTGPLQLIQIEEGLFLRTFAHEATFSQWDACYAEKGCSRKPKDFGWGRDNKPVVDISYEEIEKEFIPWLNQKTGLTFKLPSATEWNILYGNESAVDSKYANGPSGFGWGEDGSPNTSNVGSYVQNSNGLYDVNGNVWEWVDECSDANCARKVLKGGSWKSSPTFFTKEKNWMEFPNKRSDDIGFRLVADYKWRLKIE
jgi:serine/threonine protein kinase